MFSELVKKEAFSGLRLFLCITSLTAEVNSASLDVCAPNVSFGVLSYNIRVDFNGETWKERSRTIKDVLLDNANDLILIQEASEFMLGEYARMLPEHNYVVGERSDGHQGTQAWYEYLPIYYRRDRFLLLDSGSIWVSETPHVPGSTLINTKAHGRVFSWVLLRDRETGMNLSVGNVHIHGARSKDGARLVLEQLERVSDGATLLLGGDFNHEPGSPGYEYLTRHADTSLNDAFVIAKVRASSGSATTIAEGDRVPSGANKYKYGGVERRIDYLMIQKTVDVLHFDTPNSRISSNVFASDHLPVRFELIAPNC